MLKGIFKLKGYFMEWEFREWLARTNPNVHIYGGEKVAVSIKVGKRRKLKKMRVKTEWDFPCCSCCPPTRRFELVQSSGMNGN